MQAHDNVAKTEEEEHKTDLKDMPTQTLGFLLLQLFWGLKLKSFLPAQTEEVSVRLKQTICSEPTSSL